MKILEDLTQTKWKLSKLISFCLVDTSPPVIEKLLSLDKYNPKELGTRKIKDK